MTSELKDKKSLHEQLIAVYNIAWDIEMMNREDQKLFEAAINCGRSDAWFGDEISSVDLKTEERILKDIYLTAKIYKNIRNLQ